MNVVFSYNVGIEAASKRSWYNDGQLYFIDG
jgi:hypothetical protein